MRHNGLLVGVAVLGISAGLHLTAFGVAPGKPSVEIQGGGSGEPAPLGNAFADMAAGQIAPNRTTAVTAPAPPATPQTKAAPATAKAVAPVRPTDTAPQQSAALEPIAAAPVTPAGLVPVTKTQDPRAAISPPVRPSATTTEPAAASTQVPVSDADPKAEKPEEGTPASSLAVAQSARPSARPDLPDPQVALAKAQVTRRQIDPGPGSPAPQGNAKRTGKKGEDTGTRKATAKASGRGAGSAERGSDAASNYPGLVMRQIQRTRRERAGAKGEALVQFTVASNGSVRGMSIARSSGSLRVDKAALSHIRRAAPFPPPPSGAHTTFSVRVESPG